MNVNDYFLNCNQKYLKSCRLSLKWRNFEGQVFFNKKLRFFEGSESFLKFSDFQYSEFLTSFLKVS